MEKLLREATQDKVFVMENEDTCLIKIKDRISRCDTILTHLNIK